MYVSDAKALSYNERSYNLKKAIKSIHYIVLWSSKNHRQHKQHYMARGLSSVLKECIINEVKNVDSQILANLQISEVIMNITT